MMKWRIVVHRKSKLSRFLLLAIHSGLPHYPAGLTEQQFADATIGIHESNVQADLSQGRGFSQSHSSLNECLPSFSKAFENIKGRARNAAPVNENETGLYDHWSEACASHDFVSGLSSSLDQATATSPATLSYEQATASSLPQPMQSKAPWSGHPVDDTLNAAVLCSLPFSDTMDHTRPLMRQQVDTVTSDGTSCPGGEASARLQPPGTSTIRLSHGTETIIPVNEARSEWRDLSFSPPFPVDLPHDQCHMVEAALDPAQRLLAFSLPCEQQAGVATHTPSATISALHSPKHSHFDAGQSSDPVLPDSWDRGIAIPFSVNNGEVSDEPGTEGVRPSVMTNNGSGRAGVNSAENAQASLECVMNHGELDHYIHAQLEEFDAIYEALHTTLTGDLTSTIGQSSSSIRQSRCSGAISRQKITSKLKDQAADDIQVGSASQTATSQKALLHAKRHSERQNEECPAPKHNKKGIEASSVMGNFLQTSLIGEQKIDAADKLPLKNEDQMVCDAFLAFAKDFSLLPFKGRSWQEILGTRREDILKACLGVLKDESHRAWSDAIRDFYQMIDPDTKLRAQNSTRIMDVCMQSLRRLKSWPRRMKLKGLSEPEKICHDFYSQSRNGLRCSRSILLESMDGLAVYHYLLMWRCGQTLTNEFMTNPPISQYDPWLVWRERLLPLILKNRSEIIAISPYVKCLILGAVTYSVVSEALGLEGSKYWGRCPLSAEAAEQICKIVRMIMYQGCSDWQVEKGEFAKLRTLLLKCQGGELCTERVDSGYLKIASIEANSGPSVFFLDALANLFENITTLSTTYNKQNNGPKWVQSDVKRVVTQSTSAEALKYRESLMKLHSATLETNFHMKGVDTRPQRIGFVFNFHEIFKRALFLAGACTEDFNPSGSRTFMGIQRNTLHDFVDLMGLVRRVSVVEEAVRILKEQYPLTSLLLQHCGSKSGISIRSHTIHRLTNALKDKACQEIFVLSALYHVVNKNLNSNQDLYHDYSGLSDEDALELCGRVEAFFDSLRQSEPTDDVMRLPRATVDRIKQHLTRPSDSILRD